MDFPVHVAVAACVGQALIYARHRISSENDIDTGQDLMFATACVLAGMASHLILDAIPHANFLYGVGRFGRHLPYVVGKALQAPKIVLITLPVFLISWKYARQYWMLMLLALGGGVYPDMEKAAYLHSPYPRALVLFPWHSCSYSPVGWEVEYRHFLIAMEMLVYSGLLIAFYWLCRQTQDVRHVPGSFEEWFVEIVNGLCARAISWFRKAPQREL
jgi:hypothetical protein